MPRHSTSTSFRPGQSGNPRGRTPGTLTRKTVEVREVCSRLVDDPAYRDGLRQRLINGTAGAMEVLIWHYAKGKPVDRVETGAAGAFSQLSTAELRHRLSEALSGL
ncbi:MAG: hypothetical protein FJW23_13075 [Acidimicrobiia bacterium]|nr:hypothetical protein [Acidimicrobiia bacterium]